MCMFFLFIIFLPWVGSLILQGTLMVLFLWEICVLRWRWACLFRRSAEQVSSRVFIVTSGNLSLAPHNEKSIQELYISIHLLITVFWLTGAHPYHFIFFLFPPLLSSFESGLRLVTLSKNFQMIQYRCCITTLKKNNNIYTKNGQKYNIQHIFRVFNSVELRLLWV